MSRSDLAVLSLCATLSCVACATADDDVDGLPLGLDAGDNSGNGGAPWVGVGGTAAVNGGASTYAGGASSGSGGASSGGASVGMGGSVGGGGKVGAGGSPFGTGGNPFAAGGSPFGAGGNPFAAGGSPFGAGGNPFAAGSTGAGGADPNGPCKNLNLLCFDVFDMWIFNPVLCKSCNAGKGCQTCVIPFAQ